MADENVSSALPGSDVVSEYVADFVTTATRLADALERIAGAIRSAAHEGERLTKTLREELPPNLFSRERASETVPVAIVGVAALAVMFMAQRRRSRPVNARSF
ncbi:MAG: hypothetical protein JOZ84_03415 [Methylobacteriaceae bacterium]|nr:hypothetical protein [Methylobacteriaceae bacterium]